VKLFLAAGATLGAENKLGDTALIAAVRAGQLNTATALLKAGANTDLRNKDRATARDVANALGCKELQALLEKHG
jgi:ankyrin repeat protein